MKKAMFLLVFPLLLLSCSKNKGQQKVDFQTFCTYWKSPNICQRASVVDCHTVVDKDSENWSAVSTEEDVPEEEKHLEDDNVYLFDNSGSCAPEHEAITTKKPTNLTIEYLEFLGALGGGAVEYYINPLRVVISLILYQAEDDSDPYTDFYMAVIKDDSTYNDQMWLVDYEGSTYKKSYSDGEFGWHYSYVRNTYSYTYFE